MIPACCFECHTQHHNRLSISVPSSGCLPIIVIDTFFTQRLIVSVVDATDTHRSLASLAHRKLYFPSQCILCVPADPAAASLAICHAVPMSVALLAIVSARQRPVPPHSLHLLIGNSVEQRIANEPYQRRSRKSAQTYGPFEFKRSAAQEMLAHVDTQG